MDILDKPSNTYAVSVLSMFTHYRYNLEHVKYAMYMVPILSMFILHDTALSYFILEPRLSAKHTNNLVVHCYVCDRY